MNEQTWWMWVSHAIGALTFAAIVIDFIIEKRKVPLWILLVSGTFFAGGLVFGCYRFQNISGIVSLSLYAFIIPLAVWFLCGGSMIAPRRGKKNYLNGNSSCKTSVNGRIRRSRKSALLLSLLIFSLLAYLCLTGAGLWYIDHCYIS